MGFFIFLFVCNMLVPLIMLIVGISFSNHPPGTINGIYGYRTTRSMKSQEAWIFANTYFGVVWKKTGAVMCVLTAVPSGLSWWLGEKGQVVVSGVLVTLQCVVLILSIIPVEKALKENFDKSGKKIN